MTKSPWAVCYVLDIWAEPREVESLPVVLRAKVRVCGTEKETYVGSIAELEQVVEQRLDADGVTPRRWLRP